MKSKYDYELIRDYLHGLVDQDTAGRIRDLIRDDDVARNIAAGILVLEHEFNGNENEIETYIERLRQKHLKLIREEGGKQQSFGWVKIAAAILIIVMTGAVLWLTLFNKSVLERELSRPYALSAIDRGSTDANQGFEFYLNKDYRNAIKAFEGIDGDASVTFYGGLSYLYSGDYDNAITLFSSLDASRYSGQAAWFHSLALIKAGKTGEAKTILESIVARSGYKSAEARQLLNELD